MFSARISWLFFSCVVVALAGCISTDPAGTTPDQLTTALISLSPTVDLGEARSAAHVAYASAARLRHEYGLTSNPHWHNFLINTGARKRGFCFHYCEDILTELKPLNLKTLDIHWAVSDPGKDTESNALLTAKGQPLETGILLDAWRRGGNLYWLPTAKDRTWKWQEDTGPYARARMAGVNAP